MQLMAALWKCLKRSYNPALHPALGVNRSQDVSAFAEELLGQTDYSSLTLGSGCPEVGQVLGQFLTSNSM